MKARVRNPRKNSTKSEQPVKFMDELDLIRQGLHADYTNEPVGGNVKAFEDLLTRAKSPKEADFIWDRWERGDDLDDIRERVEKGDLGDSDDPLVALQEENEWEPPKTADPHAGMANFGIFVLVTLFLFFSFKACTSSLPDRPGYGRYQQ